MRRREEAVRLEQEAQEAARREREAREREEAERLEREAAEQERLAWEKEQYVVRHLDGGPCPPLSLYLLSRPWTLV